jgi:uracil-DNA glycosylase
MDGFFKSTELQKKKKPNRELVPKCGACGLYRHCNSPKMQYSGQGEKEILLLGEAPGRNEDDQGSQFVGKAGKFLAKYLDRLGIDMRRDCWLHNAIVCRPENNRTPKQKEIDSCRPYLLDLLKEKKPKVIIPLGITAVKSLIKWIWDRRILKMERWIGWQIPCQKINAWICPTWHPSYVMRLDDPNHEDKKLKKIIEKRFENCLRDAIKLSKKRPWMAPPDYLAGMDNLKSPTKAAKAIRAIKEIGDPVAWDIETDRLKPELDEAKIVCCSVAQNDRCVSFPWHGEAIEAMLDLLQSDVPKFGWNAKFEDRWIKRKHGIHVRRWAWDGMQAAHIMDNRSDITGVKFQSLVHLGQSSYNDIIGPYLDAEHGNEQNRIDEVDLDTLLTYCGTDSVLELLVGKKQRVLMGIDRVYQREGKR